ncbi:MAG: integrin alpha, partial [Planctomycetota bacterium]
MIGTPTNRAVMTLLAAGLPCSVLAQGPLSEPFPAEFDLATLDGEIGFRIDGAVANDRTGRSISSAGDVNGDGLDDLVIGAVGFDAGGVSATGAAFVVFGSSEPRDGVLNLAFLDGTDGFRLEGEFQQDYAGSSVASLGDFNGDGIDDFAIGALGYDVGSSSQVGSVYVVFGRDDGFPASLALADLDGTNGLQIAGARSGERADKPAGIGDINGDGIDDIAVGAFGFVSSYNRGRTYVLFGRDTTGGADPFPALLSLDEVSGSLGFKIDGEADGDLSGFSVAGVGDLNGDGRSDFGIGAPDASPDGLTLAGATYVVFGRDSSSPFPDVLSLSDLDGSNGFRATGAAFGDTCGWDVAAAGDINADGMDDMILGVVNGRDPTGRQQAGAAFVVFGTTGGFPASLPLSTIDGTNGFQMRGFDRDDAVGLSVVGGHDVDGDGIDDVVIGAGGVDPDGRTNAGAAYVVFGRSTPFPAAIELETLDADAGMTIPGLVAGDGFGRSSTMA